MREYPELDYWTEGKMKRAGIVGELASRDSLIKMLQDGTLALHKNGVTYNGELIMGRRERTRLLQHLGIEDVIVTSVTTTTTNTKTNKTHAARSSKSNTVESREIVYEYWDEDLDRVAYFINKDNVPSERQTAAKRLKDEGKTLKEIAVTMECSVSVARQLVFQAEYKAEKLALLEAYYAKHPDRKPS